MATHSASQASLPALPAYQQSDTNLTAHIASRYHVQSPVSYLGSNAVVSVNTYTSSAKGYNGAKDGSAMGAAQELAGKAVTRLGHRHENQAVLFLGESGSGKTTIRSHLLTALLSYSSTPLSKKLSFAAFVFDALTTTKTATTPTASKAGLFFELQYETGSSMNPTLIGGKVLDYRLERSRVTSIPSGERNFHALYYLLAGTSSQEKEHLGLETSGTHIGHGSSVPGGQKRWRYLGHPSQLKVGVDDSEGFQHFKTALRKLEFPREDIAHICELLAAILHIGQLEFEVSRATLTAPDASGGYSHEGGEEITTVKNKEVLIVIAAFLGVPARDLEQSMGYRTKTLHRERVTVMLDPKGARENADELARTLYSLLVALIMERINQRICADEETVRNTISIIDFPGFAVDRPTHSVLDQLLNNAATESFYNFCLQNYFERRADLLETEEVQVLATSYFDNSDAVKGLLKPGNGLLSILDDQMRRGKTDMQFLESLRKRFEGKNAAIEIASATVMEAGNNFPTPNTNAAFTVRHFAGEVDYPVEGLIEANGEVISGDLMNLVNYSTNNFVQELFGQEALNKVTHPKDRNAITQASVASKPSRKPSMARRRTNRLDRQARAEEANAEEDGSSDEGRTNPTRSTKPAQDPLHGASAQFLSSLESVNKVLTGTNTNSYFFFCLKPNDRRIANQFDSKCVRTQIQTLGIAEISQRLQHADFSIFMPFGEFLSSTEGEVTVIGSQKERAEGIVEERGFPENEVRVGATGVFLSEHCWRAIMDFADTSDSHGPFSDDNAYDSGYRTPHDASKRGFDEPKTALLTPGGSYLDDKTAGYFGSRDMDAKSEAGASAFKDGDMFRNLDTRSQMAEKGNETKVTPVEQLPMTGKRKRWLGIVWFLTWPIPDFVIRIVGGLKRKDVRTAWREKLAINIMIWFFCCFVIFFMIGFPKLICPTQHVFSPSELSAKNGKNGADAYISIRGYVFNLDAFLPSHYPSIIPDASILKYAGTDATALFPVQVSAMCEGVHRDGISPAVQLNYQTYNYSESASSTVYSADINAQYHDFRWATNDSRPDWFTEQMETLKGGYMKGTVGYSPQYLKTLASKEDSAIAYMYGSVYDLSQYIAGGRKLEYPDGHKPDTPAPSTDFMDDSVVQLFQGRPAQDIAKYWEALPLDPFVRQSMQRCLNKLFYVGDLDTRDSAQCLFAKYILLAISIMLVTVIGFKFLAALQFGKKNVPENLDKFVIATIPAYTEDEDSLRRAIDSAARMRYDDKRKLLCIICDGMIVGHGNDRPTPRIVLDILGVPETVDPEPLSFESLGEGLKQHNMGKVYSGLYEVQGHIVPFIVIVKIGKPSEVSR